MRSAGTLQDGGRFHDAPQAGDCGHMFYGALSAGEPKTHYFNAFAEARKWDGDELAIFRAQSDKGLLIPQYAGNSLRLQSRWRASVGNPRRLGSSPPRAGSIN